jgi:hypothetical protein
MRIALFIHEQSGYQIFIQEAKGGGFIWEASQFLEHLRKNEALYISLNIEKQKNNIHIISSIKCIFKQSF